MSYHVHFLDKNVGSFRDFPRASYEVDFLEQIPGRARDVGTSTAG